MKKALILNLLAMALLTCHGALMPPRDVTFKAKIDGTTQAYMELLPENFDKSKKHDLIIGLHGHGSDRKQFAVSKRGECAAFREFAAKHNMIAVTPDYRAKTSWMGPKAEADVTQIIKDIKQKYKIGKVFITGGSMGGTAALTFAALHPDMIAGVTSMNGHANLLEYERFQGAIASSFGGAKDKIPGEYKKRSAEYWPEKLTMPIAITVGGNDTTVPPDSVLRLAKILKKLNRKVMVIKRPRAGHSTNVNDVLTAMNFMLTGVAVKPSPAVAKAQPAAQPALPAANAKSESGGGIFFAAAKPAKSAKSRVELGLKFYVEKNGQLNGFCFYQVKGETGPHTFRLWSTAGKPLLAVKAAAAAKPGWVKIVLPKPFKVKASTEYIVSYTANKYYAGKAGVFAAPVKRDGIMAVAGLYSLKNIGKAAPNKKYKKMSYYIDVDYSKE